MVADLIALLAAPFAATLLLVAIHVWFGLHVLRRKVIFADLALAQMSAFGATFAVVLGHAPDAPASFVYSLVFALTGACLLTASRGFAHAVSQEALVGILYIVATAATVLVIDRAPQGAEHVRRMLIGNLLGVGPAQLLKIAPLYAAIAVLHLLARRPLLRASEATTRDARAIAWDLVFYASFGVVVTSSVAIAGVLLVFSLLIIPAVIGTLFARTMLATLLIGWAAGLVAALSGFAASVAFDLPTSATLVLALAAALVIAGVVRLLCHEQRYRHRPARILTAAGLSLLCAGGVWSLARPDADQPLLAALQPLGIRPELFLQAGEAAQFADAREAEQRYRSLVDALSDQERRARWQSTPLSDEDVWRIGSYQQTYNEMGKGERFVQDHLLTRARSRERWLVSLPLTLLSGLILIRRRFLFSTS